jgi:hypothetical protein
MTRKPQRRLWEPNNSYAQHWGRPLEPEPEGGFADDELRTPGFDEVVEWFRDALPTRCRTQEVPKTKIAKIARLIGEFQDMYRRPRNPQLEVALDKCHALEQAFANFRTALRPVLDCLQKNRRLATPHLPVLSICGRLAVWQSPISDHHRSKGRGRSGTHGPAHLKDQCGPSSRALVSIASRSRRVAVS